LKNCGHTEEEKTDVSEMKEFLQQGIFTQQEFDEKEAKLLQLYPLPRSCPLSPVVGVTTVNQRMLLVTFTIFKDNAG
jgi:hypothetical protein